MSAKYLSKLEEITEYRFIWRSESKHFTPWLARNIHLLGNVIGIRIHVIQTEAPVGRYSADILAQNEETSEKIIIENQLEPTNHDHLGKLITYAAGTDATLIIWVVKKAHLEHRAAVTWLNRHTDAGIRFMLLEIVVYKLYEGKYGTTFDIIEKPEDWLKNKIINKKEDKTKKEKTEKREKKHDKPQSEETIEMEDVQYDFDELLFSSAIANGEEELEQADES